MQLVDIWAAAAAGVAAAALALRANMLKPHSGVWALAPAPVWGSLSGLAIGLGMAVVTILGGAHATPREAAIYTLLAGSALVLLWNLHRNGRADVLARLQGRAGLVTTVTTLELRDPAAVAAKARATGARRGGR